MLASQAKKNKQSVFNQKATRFTGYLISIQSKNCCSHAMSLPQLYASHGLLIL